jgi:hypothetical protein
VLCSSWNFPTPEAGTCRLAGVEPFRGSRRERTELKGYKLYQTAAALAACVPDAHNEETVLACALSGREGNYVYVGKL